MTKYESTVKYLPYPVERVFAKLSDMTNLEVLRENAGNPALREQILSQADGKVTPEQVDKIAERMQQLEFTPDSVSTQTSIGLISLNIVEREATKLVKFEVAGAPVQANLWIQMLPNGEGQSAMKVTIGAELNVFIKQMLKGKLKDGVEQLATMLSMLPY